MTKATELIIAERERQITEEGYDATHDSGHARSLARAAAAYAVVLGEPYVQSPTVWPWAEHYWKPTGDPVRDLVKAGALIAAAIDSLLAEEGIAMTNDPYLNEIFESTDSRDGGKRIRVIAKAPATRFYPAGYHYRRVDEFGQFAGRANRVHISAETLDTRYRKVSR